MAFDDIPAPDFADVVVVAVPPTRRPVTTDPAEWARAVFSAPAVPLWAKLLIGVRQLVVGLIGVSRGDSTVFDVQAVRGEEALISMDDRHLDFRAGVAYDPERRLLRVTTVVRLKGWRGRVYFAPVSLVHNPMVRAMTRKAVRRAARCA